MMKSENTLGLGW